ncbi:MAG: SLC13 family permease [Fusobacterium sp.]
MLVILGFLTNSFSQIGLAIISILGSSILVLISKKKPEEIFSKIEWDTLFFFGALFVLIQGLEELGIIEFIGSYVVTFTQGNLKLTSSLLVLVSGILSPIVGSIPLSLSFGKLVLEILPNYTGNTESLWWALSLGCCLGGNMTIVGAAANMVGTSVSKKVGIEISFKEFFKWGIIIVIQSIILSLIYINIRY